MLSALVNPALHLIHYGITSRPAPIILATMYNELSPAEAFSFNAILINTTTDHEVHIYVYLLHGSLPHCWPVRSANLRNRLTR